MSLILEEREKRFYKVKQIVNEYNKAIIVKCNIPGEEKTFKEVYLLLLIFKTLVENQLKTFKVEFQNSHDGPYLIYYDFKESPNKLKEVFLKLEESHFLGRIIDIDVYSRNKTLTRNDLNLPQRKCLICDNEAWLCMKNRAHTVNELKEEIINKTNFFIKDDLTKTLHLSFKSELNLHPKFGLVTPYSNGSHNDMDYFTMLSSIEVILPYLLKIYEVGFQTTNIKVGFNKIRKIGIDAEKAMYKVTKGINTYKGAIFLIGVMMYALGYYHQNKNLSYPEIIKTISKNILLELEGRANTFGIYAHQQFKMYTIRHEVYYGIPTVYLASDYLNKYGDFNKEAFLMTLIFIIKEKKDTVALKRANNMDNYNKWVKKISNIKKFDLKLINKVTEEAIKEDMSFGGSADILIAAIFLSLITKKGYLKEL